MQHDEQVKTVGQLISLERGKESAEQQVQELEGQSFSQLEPFSPKEPKHKQVDRKIPEKVLPTAKSKVHVPSGCALSIGYWAVLVAVTAVILFASGQPHTDGIGDVLFIVLLVVGCVLLFQWRNRREEEEIRRVSHSEEFKNEVAQAERKYEDKIVKLNHEYDERQKKYDAQYEEDMSQYEQDLKEYSKDHDAWAAEKAKWEEQHDAAVDKAEASLSEISTELASLYETSQLIPPQFKNIESLEAIYSIISASNYDVKEAINLHKDNLRQALEQQRLQEQMRANEQAEQQNAFLGQQNELLQEQNEIAEKARIEANIAQAIAVAQRRKDRKEDEKRHLEDKKRENQRMKDEFFRRQRNGEDTGSLPIDWRL